MTQHLPPSYLPPSYLPPPPSDPHAPATRVRAPARFWSAADAFALTAGIVPFFVSATRSTVETVNGKVVRFVYSDSVATACGIATIVFGVVAALKLRTTAPTSRPLRVLLVLAFVGLGVLQLLRGAGTFQSPPRASRDRDAEMERMLSQRAAAAAAAAAAPADLDARARTALDLWQASKVDELREMLSAAVREKTDVVELGDAIALWTAAVGPCRPWTTPLIFHRDDGAWRARADIRCGARDARVEVAFVMEHGQPAVRELALTPDDRPQERAAFDALARHMAERLAAGDLAGFAQQLVPAVRRELDPVDATQAELQRVLAEAGRIRRLEQVEATPEKGRRIAYTFAVSAQKHSLRIRISLEEIHGRLFATSFVVEPAPADR